MKELSVKAKIVKWLNSLPDADFEVSPPNSPTGKPDITGCLNGRYVAIEVKRPKKAGGRNAKRHQIYRLRQLAKAGALCMVARSVAEVREQLKIDFMIYPR